MARYCFKIIYYRDSSIELAKNILFYKNKNNANELFGNWVISCCYDDVYFISFLFLYKENVSLELIPHYPFFVSRISGLKLLYGVIPCI